MLPKIQMPWHLTRVQTLLIGLGLADFLIELKNEMLEIPTNLPHYQAVTMVSM
jgi:hypothetical protein